MTSTEDAMAPSPTREHLNALSEGAVAPSSPTRQHLSALSEGARRWLGDNLAYFDPFSDACPFPEHRKAKAMLELAVVCRVWAGLAPATDVLDRASDVVRSVWRRPEFLDLIETHGGPYADAQRLMYAALAPDGTCDDARAETLARLRKEGFLSPGDRSPYPQLETRYYADLAGVPHDLPAYRQLAAAGPLAAPPTPPVSLGDAYTITHTAFYLSDYGMRPIDLSPAVRDRATAATTRLLGSSARQDLWDLTGELLITHAALGGDPLAAPEGRAALACLTGVQQPDGAIPGRAAATRAAPCLTPPQFFRKAYHTTLVAVLVSLIVR